MASEEKKAGAYQAKSKPSRPKRGAAAKKSAESAKAEQPQERAADSIAQEIESVLQPQQDVQPAPTAEQQEQLPQEPETQDYDVMPALSGEDAGFESLAFDDEPNGPADDIPAQMPAQSVESVYSDEEQDEQIPLVYGDDFGQYEEEQPEDVYGDGLTQEEDSYATAYGMPDEQEPEDVAFFKEPSAPEQPSAAEQFDPEAEGWQKSALPEPDDADTLQEAEDEDEAEEEDDDGPVAVLREMSGKKKRKHSVAGTVFKAIGLVLLCIGTAFGILYLLEKTGYYTVPEQYTQMLRMTGSPQATPLPSLIPAETPAPTEEPVNLTSPADPTLWSLILCNTANALPEGYEDNLNLVEIDNSGHLFDARAANALMQMIRDGNEQYGLHLKVLSSYRSYAYQEKLFNSSISEYEGKGMTYEEAYAQAKLSRNEPGKSEHESGLAADIVAESFTNLVDEFGDTDEGKWLAEHCAEYGFILRYPQGKTDITGTIYEPWHFRYVGVEDATKIMQSGQCLEEYLGVA